MRRNTTNTFWSRVDRSAGPDACWPWTKRTKPTARGGPEYGIYDHDNTWSYAHRYAYELVNGTPEHFVLHRCDNPPCCNPAHLYDGTQQQNVQDREARGRRNVKGERHPRAKLTDRECLEIMDLYRAGVYTQLQLSPLYGVSNSTISLITSGKRNVNATQIRCDVSVSE